MVELVEMDLLDKEAAMEIAQAIHISNPRHITLEIVEDFKKIIKT